MSATSATAVPAAAITLPLLSSVGYVAAILLVKRASIYGVGLWRTAFVSNLFMGLCFAPLWLLGGQPLDATAAGQGLLCALLFFAGQIFTFIAMSGDVSLATPVLGLKILFVAGASAVLVDEPVRPAWWGAAALATAAVALLQSAPRDPARPAARPGRTILHAALAALAFALSDVLVQRFTPAWGAGRFLPLMFGLVAVLSFALVPFFSAPLRGLPPTAWRWLAPGCILLAVQASGMAYALGVHGHATLVNILYGSRGLWSVLAIGLLGAWLGSAGENRLPRPVFLRRLAGAGLLLAAVALALG